MKTFKRIVLPIVIIFSLLTSGTPKHGVTISKVPDLSKYKFVYVTPVGGKTSISGGAVGNQYGTYGSTSSKSTNPTDLIAGSFMMQGFIRVAEITEEQKAETFIVNYGEVGRKEYGVGSAAVVILQLIDASENELICNVTAEGLGETEADDIRKAITKCVNAIFKDSTK